MHRLPMPLTRVAEGSIRSKPPPHSTSVCGVDVMGRGRADGWQSGTRLRLDGGGKAQREVLISSRRIQVHTTIAKDPRGRAIV